MIKQPREEVTSVNAEDEILAVVEKAPAKEAEVVDGLRKLAIGDWYWVTVREEDRAWYDEEDAGPDEEMRRAERKEDEEASWY